MYKRQADGQLGIDGDAIVNITAPLVDIDASTRVDISAQLNVGDDIFVGDNLYVSGTTTMAGLVGVTDDINVGIDLHVTDDVYVSGNLNVAEYIYHGADADTFIRFQADDINIQAGGVDFIKITEDGSQDIIVFNEGSADVDFRVESDNNTHALFVDLSLIHI